MTAETDVDIEWAVFCANGAMHYAVSGGVKHRQRMSEWADQAHPDGAPHGLRSQRVLFLGWEPPNDGMTVWVILQHTYEDSVCRGVVWGRRDEAISEAERLAGERLSPDWGWEAATYDDWPDGSFENGAWSVQPFKVVGKSIR